ncbi:MAG: hypothetical protein RBJ76_24440 [Stenomitos frigidus ULC029]
MRARARHLYLARYGWLSWRYPDYSQQQMGHGIVMSHLLFLFASFFNLAFKDLIAVSRSGFSPFGGVLQMTALKATEPLPADRRRNTIAVATNSARLTPLENALT